MTTIGIDCWLSGYQHAGPLNNGKILAGYKKLISDNYNFTLDKN